MAAGDGTGPRAQRPVGPVVAVGAFFNNFHAVRPTVALANQPRCLA